jgi:predicted ribosomally synthesized peptide with nif11-like leader
MIAMRETKVMQCKEILNSEEAAELLGIQPFAIRAYAQRGLIPGKKLDHEWYFLTNEVLAWLRSMKVRVADLEIALTGAKGFIQRLQRDSQFKQKVRSISTHAELITFARQEGFAFTLQEFKEVLKLDTDDDLANDHIPRIAERQKVYLRVIELNGQPVFGTKIFDINAWGARVGSFDPFDARGNINITFTPPGGTQNVCLSGEMVWSKFMSVDNHYYAGVEFSKPLMLYRKSKI